MIKHHCLKCQLQLIFGGEQYLHIIMKAEWSIRQYKKQVFLGQIPLCCCEDKLVLLDMPVTPDETNS